MAQHAGQVSPDGLWIWNGSQWVPNPPPAAPPALAAWARPFESASYRATFLTILLLSNAAALVIGIIFDTVFIAFGGNPAALSGGQALAVALLGAAYVVTYYGTLIPSIVLFCMWLHRVVRNMPALGSWDARWSPSGAVWRCFIPFLNLVHPMLGTLEAWRASDPAHRWANLAARRAIRPPWLIVAWWTAWLLRGIATSISLQLGRSGDPGLTTASTWFDLLSAVLEIAAAAAAILVVREVTARENRKNELIQTGQLA